MSQWASSVARRVVGAPLGSHLGMTLLEAEPELVRVRLPFRRENTTAGDQVHGGAIAALIDAVATAVAWSGVDSGAPPSRGTTVHLEVSYLAPARGCELVATGKVSKRGRNLCFCQIEVHAPGGELVSRGSAVYKLG